ncbi:palindromic element RPE1 domain-containing protein [Candidatus Tisiphia endosymbiont of Oplodontha viridula]|uniref:palindromic element RPE1 domain-containing protein n=1 Tax=Candidatus Tisiphia endosymbiont of Oplodontha viridula TaxID=3077925 RepID=UPI0035C8999F
MTKSLTFSSPVVENQDIIFYNFVGNFIPPEWRNLTNNCGKQLSKTSRQLLSLIVSCIKTDNHNDTKELQEGYHFFQKELEVCQKRVKQCLTELQTSGFIDFALITTTIKHNLKCRNILSIKLLKKFMSFRKANDNSYQFNYTNSQSIHKKISIQPEKIYHPTVKNFQKNASIYISILSRYGKNQENCGQVCGQTASEPESTEEQNVNLPLEVTEKRGKKSVLETASTTEQSFNLSSEVMVSSDEQNLPELGLAEEKSFNLPTEITVSSVNEALPYNSTDGNRPLQKLAYAEEFEGDTERRTAAYSDVREDSSTGSTHKLPAEVEFSKRSNFSEVTPTDDKSNSDSDSDSTDGYSGGSESEQEASGKLSGWLADIAKKAKGWYLPRKLEEFYPLTEEDATWLRKRTGRNYELSYINKLLIKHSVDSPNNRFPCKQAVLDLLHKSI